MPISSHLAKNTIFCTFPFLKSKFEKLTFFLEFIKKILVKILEIFFCEASSRQIQFLQMGMLAN